jgi:hypothetical protein
MAQAVAVGDIVQVTPRYEIEGQQTENVMYFQCLNADPNMLANLLLVVATCIITHLLPALGSNCTLESVHGKIVGPAVGGEDEWTPGTGDVVAGAAAGDSEPSFVAAVVSLYTAHPGRTGRGRMFIGGIPEGSTTGSLLNIETGAYPAIVATMACIAAAFPLRELGSAAAYEWGQYSRKDGAVTKPPYPVVGYHGITRFVVRRELGTQRRRKLGRGK